MSAALASFHLTTGNWILVGACALLIGLNKTGLPGVSLVTIPLIAGVFGAKESTAIILLMFIVGDVFAVSYYHRHAQWRYVVRLLPWTAAGIVLGVAVGGSISDRTFRILLSVIIVAGLVVMVWQEWRTRPVRIPETWWMAAILGIASGFTSMVGNAAASIMALYLLAMRLPKNSFIGTGAWFFFIVNLIKIPFHFFVWHTITVSTLSADLVLAPLVVLGAIAGVLVVRRIPERPYRILIIIATAVAAFRLVI